VNHGLSYIALGDSLTIGTGAMFSGGFVQQYAQFTERILNYPLQVQTFAKNGMNSSKLVELITRNQSIRSAILRANIITITIGGNDLLEANRLFQETFDFQIFHYTVKKLSKNLNIILSEIHSLKYTSSTPYFIRIISLFNPFPNIMYSEYWVTNFNQVLRSFTSKNIEFVNVSHLFKFNRKLISFDRLHPSKEGYKRIAEEIVKKGYYPLT
jgi:lysophospholipase L1-like esterase